MSKIFSTLNKMPFFNKSVIVSNIPYSLGELFVINYLSFRVVFKLNFDWLDSIWIRTWIRSPNATPDTKYFVNTVLKGK
jgi:hypothetical protein